MSNCGEREKSSLKERERRRKRTPHGRETAALGITRRRQAKKTTHKRSKELLRK